MPWIKRTFRSWFLSFYRDGSGAFYVRFLNGRLRRLGADNAPGNVRPTERRVVVEVVERDEQSGLRPRLSDVGAGR